MAKSFLPESDLFQAAFAATIAGFTTENPEPRTPEEQDDLDRSALRAMGALGHAEGAAAVARLHREIELYLLMERKKTEQMQTMLDLLSGILQEREDMTIGEALAIFNERGGREH